MVYRQSEAQRLETVRLVTLGLKRGWLRAPDSQKQNGHRRFASGRRAGD